MALPKMSFFFRRGISVLRGVDASKEAVEKYLRCRKDVTLSVCLVEDGTIHPCCEPPRIIIIGAGVAGLSAANRLLQCGLDNFVVLEATDRPGGRVHSCYMGNVVTEMGASSILGGSVKNPIYALASREGLIPPVSNEFPIDRGICMTSQGIPVPKLVNETAPLSMGLINKQAAELFGKDTGEVGSLWDFFCMRIHQECDLYPEKYRRYAARHMFAITNDFRAKVGADLSKVSASQYGSYVPCPGVDTRIPTGMIGILAPLLRQMPTCDHILYCKAVNKIIWSEKLSKQSDRVKVVCCDGTTYNGDYVILTMSLGVLKENLGMFVPALPKEKINAITKMGYGNCVNIFLEYAKPFWVWKSGTLRLGWSLKELKSRNTCPDWIKAIGTVDETVGTQQSLMFSISDIEADIAEKLSDVKVAEDSTRMLRMFTGDPTIPYPVNVLKSAWTSSPYFRGARPYIPAGTTILDQCALAQPVPSTIEGIPVMMFAGDATASGMTGTLHGARVSWLRRKGDNLHLISVNMEIYNPDPRYRINFIKPEDWQLHIMSVNYTDQGNYECQINSHPPIVHSVYVQVVVPELEIKDERDLPIKNKFYNSGSTIELRCLIVKVPQPTQFIIWRHNSTILNYDTTRGGISVKTDILPDGAKSQLYIANVGPTDSGNYSCSLGEEAVTWVSVVVITGETPAAMQHGCAATSANLGLLTLLSAVLSALS